MSGSAATEGNIELRMDFDLRRGFFGTGGTADWVAQRGLDGGFVFQEGFGVFHFPGPCDAAEQDGAEGRVGEIFIPMAGDADEGTAVAGFIGPHLRLDVVDVHRLAGLCLTLFRLRGVGGGENFHLGKHVHIVVDLVIDIEVRRTTGDGVLAVGEVKGHVALQPFGFPEMPGAADDGLIPIVIA